MLDSQDEEILVSISSTTYNHASYIRQCLDGFLMQKTNFKFEILIHDDASTDGTADIIREYQEKYPDIVKPIYQTENQYSKGIPISATFNWPRAKGKYIALCEGDDYWTDPLKLQKQVDFLEEHPEYSLCFHNAIVHYENQKSNDHLFSEIQTREYSRRELLTSWKAPTASFLFRKDVLDSDIYDKVKHSKRLVYGDLPLILSASYFGKIYGMMDVMSIYRKHQGGAMNTHLSIPIKLCWHQIESRRLFGEDVVPIFNDLIGRHASIAISQFRHGYIQTAVKLWWISFLHAPVDSLRWTFKYFHDALRKK